MESRTNSWQEAHHAMRYSNESMADKNENAKRACIAGGFPPGTRREIIVEALTAWLEEDKCEYEEVFAPALHGRVGIVRLETNKRMWKWVAKQKGRTHTYNSLPLWFKIAASEEERARASTFRGRHTSSFKHRLLPQHARRTSPRTPTTGKYIWVPLRCSNLQARGHQISVPSSSQHAVRRKVLD